MHGAASGVRYTDKVVGGGEAVSPGLLVGVGYVMKVDGKVLLDTSKRPQVTKLAPIEGLRAEPSSPAAPWTGCARFRKPRKRTRSPVGVMQTRKVTRGLCDPPPPLLYTRGTRAVHQRDAEN